MPIFVGAGTSSFMKDTGGVGFSKRTSTEIDNLTGMVSGQVVFDTTVAALKFYDGSNWLKVSSVQAILNSVTGNIYVGSATNLSLSGEGFLSGNLVVNFTQSSDNINVNVTVNPSSDTAATVAVPSSVYNNVTAGNVVAIKVTNSDGTTSGTVNKTAVALPSGGSITSAGGYRYHTFTSSGNFVNTIASLSTEFLLVAGGGGGGSGDDGSGGGSGAGAGGAIDGTATLNVGTYGVVIGGGGAGGHRSGGGTGTSGSNSTFNSNTAIGGGFGVDNGVTTNGQGGGSGGGGFRSGSVGSGTSGQGTNGGSGAGAGAPAAGGGGGGKGGGGGNATSTNGGSGGPGINWKSLGTFYAGGGGGGGDGSGSGGSGGSGIGGNGTSGGTQSNNSNHATANRGSGGGGTGGSTGTYYRGSNGSGGILIIRYQL